MPSITGSSVEDALQSDARPDARPSGTRCHKRQVSMPLPQAIRRGNHVVPNGPASGFHVDGDDFSVVAGFDLAPDVPLVDLVAQAGRLCFRAARWRGGLPYLVVRARRSLRLAGTCSPPFLQSHSYCAGHFIIPVGSARQITPVRSYAVGQSTRVTRLPRCARNDRFKCISPIRYPAFVVPKGAGVRPYETAPIAASSISAARSICASVVVKGGTKRSTEPRRRMLTMRPLSSSIRPMRWPCS